MQRKILILIRKLLSPFFKEKERLSLRYDRTEQEASDYIKALLESDKPVMICRFGSTELNAITGYRRRISLGNAWLFVSKQIDTISYSKHAARFMYELSGFFPSNKKTLDRFSQEMIDLMPMVDVLGVWRYEERIFDAELSNAIKVPLGDLEPYFHTHPWSEVLAGKKVLVIHPFKDSIAEQYPKHDLLFKDPRVLPRFDIQIIQAVQSLGSHPDEYASWFYALEAMKRQIDEHDFDIAIIGCGAYGFPLAAYVKSIGKKAVHLGGATQILFGIKSKSWEDDDYFRTFFNENWIKPKESERPANYLNVEGGRYW